MKSVIPSPNVQAKIQALNAAVRQEYGAEAYISMGDGNAGSLIIGSRTDYHIFVNGLQQAMQPLQQAPQQPQALPRQRQRLLVLGG